MFDRDPRVIGIAIESIPAYDVKRRAEVVEQEQIQLGMITVAATDGQHAADRLAAAGISGIVNFAPVALSLSEELP